MIKVTQVIQDIGFLHMAIAIALGQDMKIPSEKVDGLRVIMERYITLPQLQYYPVQEAGFCGIELLGDAQAMSIGFDLVLRGIVRLTQPSPYLRRGCAVYHWQFVHHGLRPGCKYMGVGKVKLLNTAYIAQHHQQTSAFHAHGQRLAAPHQ